MRQYSQLRFYLDLNRKYDSTLSNLIPENCYKIMPNDAIRMIEEEKLSESYPIFVEHGDKECLIGLFEANPRGCLVHFYFGNFNTLNSIFKTV